MKRTKSYIKSGFVFGFFGSIISIILIIFLFDDLNSLVVGECPGCVIILILSGLFGFIVGFITGLVRRLIINLTSK